MNMLFINQSWNRGLHTHYGHRFPQNGMDHHPLYIMFLITLTHDVPIRYQSYIQLIASRGICLEKTNERLGIVIGIFKKSLSIIELGYDIYIWNYSLDLSYHFSDIYNGHRGHSHRFPDGGARRSCKRLWRTPRPRPRRPRRRSSGARRCRRPWRRPRRRGRRPRCGGPWGHGAMGWAMVGFWSWFFSEVFGGIWVEWDLWLVRFWDSIIFRTYSGLAIISLWLGTVAVLQWGCFTTINAGPVYLWFQGQTTTSDTDPIFACSVPKPE